MNCIILDDQSIDADYLHTLCNDCGIEVKGVFNRAIDAINFLNTNNVALAFLDIDMPDISGLDLAKLMPKGLLIVFVSSHKQYAIDAYDVDAMDFISKPVTLSRLIQTYSKAKALAQLVTSNNEDIQQKHDDFVILKIDGMFKKFMFSDINYIESMSNFVKIHTSEKISVSYGTASFFEDHLPEDLFMRVHRQFLINLNKVTAFSSNEAIINGIKIPIGNAYKETFMQQALKKGYIKTR